MVFVCYHLVLEKEVSSYAAPLRCNTPRSHSLAPAVDGATQRGLLADVPGIVRNFLFPRWAGKAKWTRYAPFVTRDAGGKLIFG